MKTIDEISRDLARGRHSAYTPVSAYEDPRLLRRINLVAPISLMAATLVNYTVAVLSIKGSTSGFFRLIQELLLSNSAVLSRFQDLQSYKEGSGLQYISIMIASSYVALISGIILTIYYVTFVLIPGGFARIDRKCIKFFSYSILTVALFNWIAYFAPLGISGVERIGMRWFFIWPAYPLTASLMAVINSFFVLYIFSTVAKVAFQCAGNSRIDTRKE